MTLGRAHSHLCLAHTYERCDISNRSATEDRSIWLQTFSEGTVQAKQSIRFVSFKPAGFSAILYRERPGKDALPTGSPRVEELHRQLTDLTSSASGELVEQVKKFVKNAQTEYGLYEQTRDQFINSPDEDIRKFVALIQRPFYASSSLLNFVVSIFQLIIAAFLLVLGISVISPSVLNLSVPDILQQFASIAQSPGGNNGTYVLEGLLSLTGIAFITDAFNHLRSAAFYLRIAGIELQEPNAKH